MNTSSTSGLLGSVGQANYATAKAGLAAFGIVLAQELGRYGVRVNTIAPGGRTRLLLQTFGSGTSFDPPSEANDFDEWHPGNVSPLVAYLATDDCPFTGGVFFVKGGEVEAATGWSVGARISKPGRWTIEELATAMTALRPPAAFPSTS